MVSIVSHAPGERFASCRCLRVFAALAFTVTASLLDLLLAVCAALLACNLEFTFMPTLAYRRQERGASLSISQTDCAHPITLIVMPVCPI